MSELHGWWDFPILWIGLLKWNRFNDFSLVLTFFFFFFFSEKRFLKLMSVTFQSFVFLNCFVEWISQLFIGHLAELVVGRPDYF